MSLRKKWIVLLGGAALLAAILACNFVPPQQVSEVTPAAQFATEDPYLEIPRVKLADAKAAYDNHTAIFVDARSPNSYAEGHVPGALSIPLAEIGTRMNELDRNQWIITYCT